MPTGRAGTIAVRRQGGKAKAEAPLGSLRYLYMGSSDAKRDLDYYTKVLGAGKVWDFTAFGARVAAVRLFEGPLVLIADHRPAPSCLLVFEVEDLKEATQDLRKRGWRPDGTQFEIPNGPCYVFKDPSGNPLAIFEEVRPGLMERQYADPDNAEANRG